jgi:hypothetical protein
LEIADRISRELSVRPIIIDAHAKVTYGRREVLTNSRAAYMLELEQEKVVIADMAAREAGVVSSTSTLLDLTTGQAIT